MALLPFISLSEPKLNPSLSNEVTIFVTVDSALVDAYNTLTDFKQKIGDDTIDFVSKNFGTYRYNSALCRRELRKIMRDGHKLDDKPRIEVSTIHASKGGERDNVMLLTDLSYGPYKSSKDSQQGRDDELRVFYVGATRAKRKLVIVHTTEAQFEFEPIFFHERQAS